MSLKYAPGAAEGLMGQVARAAFTLDTRPAATCEDYLRLIDSCISDLKAQGPSRTCNESKEEEEED